MKQPFSFRRPAALLAATMLALAGCTSRDPAPKTLEATFPSVASQVRSGLGFVQHDDRYLPMLPTVADPVLAAEAALTRRSGLRLELPADGSKAFTVAFAAGQVAHVREQSLRGGPRAEGRALAYARGDDGTSYFSVTQGGFEEWLEVKNATEDSIAEWLVTGLTLRQDRDGAELVDDAGNAVGKVTAPFAVDASGNRARAWLEVSGPRLALKTSARGHVLVDPLWTSTSSVSARFQHSATLLLNGKVLVVGGRTVIGAGPLNTTVELYDPATGTFTTTASMTTARFYHTATLLKSGRVLVAGGEITGGVSPSVTATAQLFDPAGNGGAGSWVSTMNSMTSARYRHAATLLPDGRVLLSGGRDATDGPVATSELFTEAPGGASTFAATTGPMSGARDLHTSTLLPSGLVLVVGGRLSTPDGERFDPALGTWSSTGNMNAVRGSHTATLLPNGRVLVVGGNNGSPTGSLASSELYDPFTNTFSLGPTMLSGRESHSATLLPTNKVAVIAGVSCSPSCSYPLSSYVFDNLDGGVGGWTTITTNMRGHHTATLLPTGQVLVIGGATTSSVLSSAEQYDSTSTAIESSSTSPAVPNMPQARLGHTSTRLANGQVLVAGGQSSGGILASASLYSPTTRSWAATGSMGTPRSLHTATVLNDGRVLVCGGITTTGPTGTSSCEVYSPSSGLWTPTGSLVGVVWSHAAVLLRDGRVLLTGGQSESGLVAYSAAYTPSTGVWTNVGTAPTARHSHTLTLLNDGRVVMAGGTSASATAVATSDIFNPTTNTWSSTFGPMTTTRTGHTAIVLTSGKVLATGGLPSDGGAALATSELFDPTVGAGGSWSAGPALAFGRHQHATAMMRNNRVLVFGGYVDSISGQPYSEAYDPSSGTSGIGSWFSAGNASSGRIAPVGTALNNGNVLFSGGRSSAVLNTAEEYVVTPALGAAELRPTLNPRSMVAPNATFALTGSRFTGVSESASGSTLSSASNVPFLQLELLSQGNRSLVPLASWDAGTLVIDGGIPTGLYLARVLVNGTASDPVLFPVFPALGLSPSSITVAPRGSTSFTPSGSAGSGYTWAVSPNNSGGSIDGGFYLAGDAGSVSDTVVLTDTLGNTVTAVVTVGPLLAIVPAAPVSTPPKGSFAVSTTGGSGTGLTWLMDSSPSGGTTNGVTYTAGAIGNVTDVLRVIDSLGNSALRNVTVTPGVSITPATLNISPRARRTFAADGGSGTGYVWLLQTNASGATFDAGAAYYVAGATPNTTDVVRVTDSLTNTATVTINVRPAMGITPSSATVAPGQQLTFGPVGGEGPWAWSLAAGQNNSDGGIDMMSGAYRAGSVGGVTDTVRLDDAVGNVATALVTVGPGVSISPANPSVPPRGVIDFASSGGSDAGFAWAMVNTGSGATIGASDGLYTAGTNGSATDVVRVTDSLGNTTTTTITVTGGVNISPASATVTPRGAQTFTASGGSDAGFTWVVLVNNSDGGINATSGAYTAGSVGSVTDTVRATDSLGNTQTATISVTAGIGISPQSASTPPLGLVSFSATGGAGGPYTWSFATKNSGASASISSGGAYQAGPIEAIDTIRVVDGLGNAATAQVTVTNALAITPGAQTLPPRGSQQFTATGGSFTGYAWSLPTNNSGATFDAGTAFYVAGFTGGVTDTVRVTDSLGAVANATITITAGASVTPSSAATTPKGTLTFVAAGGSNTGFTWSLPTNASGGSISSTNATTGAYAAGTTGSVTDVVQVTDSLGNTATASVMVSAGITITPAAPTVPPQGTLSLAAMGGTGLGFTWSFVARPSGASLDPTSGLYQAGTRGGVTDVVQVRDSALNVATVNISVGSGVVIAPAMPSVVPLGTLQLTATGGSDGGYAWAVRTNLSGGSVGATTGLYTAGSTGNVTDVVEASDALGNVGTVNVRVSGTLALMPSIANQAPRSTRVFTVMGGSEPYSWRLSTNGSGGSVDDGGVYTAGPTPSVTDIVAVTDSLGNATAATVQVTAGVSVTPGTATIAPRGTQTFSAAGGSGAPFSWSLQTNASGGSIDAMGAYVAGTKPGSDVVQATDALGNVGTATVSVVSTGDTVDTTPFAERPPLSGWSCGCEASPPGAAGAFAALALLAFGRRRRWRASSLAVAATLGSLLVTTPGWAAPSGKEKKASSTKAKKATAPAPAPAPEPPPAPAPPVAAPTPPPAPTKKEKPSVAVLDVEVTVPNESLDRDAFSEMLVSAFDGAGMFRVTSAKDLATMLGLERQRQLMGCAEDSSCMAEIANSLGTDLVLVSTVGKVADNYLVTARLIEGRRSRVAARGSVQSKDANMLLSAVWSAAQQTIDAYGNSLPADEAAVWAKRVKQTPPAALVAAEGGGTPSSFGVTVGAVAGYQVLSMAGQRGSIGVQIDGTWRLKRFDLAAGVLIGPNVGVRLTATWALLVDRLRLAVGLRGATYPGLLLFGGGPAVVAELGITPWLAASAVGGADFFPAASGPVVVLLANLGAAMHF